MNVTPAVLIAAGLIAGTGLAGLIWLFGYSSGVVAQIRRDTRERIAERASEFYMERQPDDPGLSERTQTP